MSKKIRSLRAKLHLLEIFTKYFLFSSFCSGRKRRGSETFSDSESVDNDVTVSYGVVEPQDLVQSSSSAVSVAVEEALVDEEMEEEEESASPAVMSECTAAMVLMKLSFSPNKKRQQQQQQQQQQRNEGRGKKTLAEKSKSGSPLIHGFYLMKESL